MNLPIHRTLLVAFGLALALPAAAQQAPITGRMMDGQTPAATPAATPPSANATPAQAMPQQVAPPGAADGGANASAASPALADVGDDGGIGYTTRQLLRMQASGSQAGPSLPMLGDEATAAYRRYLQSFNHPIPEFFQSTVNRNGSGSSSGY